jgi:hypothetical protein
VLLVDDLQVIQIRAKTTVHTQNLVVDDSADRENIEAKSKFLPYLHIISPFALVVETIHPIDGLALVVASKKEYLLRVLDFVCQQQTNRLDALLTAVNIIADE